MGSNPPLRRPFFRHHSKKTMECSNLPGIVACTVILVIGGWTLRIVVSASLRLI